MKEFGQFKLTQEDLERMGITQEMLQVFPKSSEIPEGFMSIEEATKYVNNLVKTDPLWREVFGPLVRK